MRDKVKRFISILMTALMLVNLLPVGALAEGMKLDSNSVQSKVSLTADSGTAPIETGHVYVYVKIDGASPETLAKFKLNSSGWYTIGFIEKTMPGKGKWKPYWYGGGEWVITPTPSDTKTYQPGDNTGAGVLPAYSIVGLKPWEDNKLIPLGNVRWTGYKLTTGANNYQPESIFSWHMDGIVNFKEINVPYTVKHVVKDSSPEIVLKEETKNKKYGQMTDATKLKFEGYKHVGKIENQIIGDDPITIYVYYEPDKKQTVDVTYKTSEGGTIKNGGTYKIQPVTGNLSNGGRLPIPIPTAADGYEFVGWERDDGQTYNDLNDVYSKLNQKTADAGTYTLYQNTTFTAKFKKNSYKLKINYVYEDGSEAAVSHEDTLSYPYSYNVNSPVIPGYKADKSVVTGTLTEDTTVTVTYSKRTDLSYTVNYYWNGTTTKVADSKTITGQMFGEEVTESPIGADGYTPVSTGPKTITIGTGTNEINFYYYRNVKLTANSRTLTYDGYEHGVSGFTGAPNGVTFVGITEPSAAGTDVGTYWAEFEKDKDKPGYPLNKVDTTGKYIVTAANPGTLTITPVTDEVVVKIAGNTKTETYNGNPYSVEGYTVTSISNTLYTEDDFEFSGEAKATGTNAGTYPMNLEAKQFNNTNTNFSKVTFVVEDGKLVIDPIAEVVVNIKGNTKTETYNGNPYSVEGYTVTSISNPLYKEGDFSFSGDDSVSGINAGKYDMELKASDFANTNANFSKVTFVIEDGQLVIEKRKVTLTSASDSKVYDGTPLTKKEVTVGGDGFAKDEGVTYTFKGSQTNAGSSKNMFTYAWNEGTNKDNYTIYQIEGDLVVTPIDGIKVTITGRKDTQTYDGKPHKVEGYDVKPDNPLFTEKDIEFNGEAEATGTDVRIDPYQMGLKPEQFTNTSNNFTNVEFVVEDGQIVITPRAVTLTSETAGKTYDGTALEKPVVTVGGDGFVEGQVKEIKATGSVTNAGSVANTITFTPNKETFKEGNYAITKTEGTLTIAKRSVLITSQSATKTYDGSALTRPAVTITGDGFVPGELAKAEATGSITKVGSTPNAIRYTTTGAFNAANYSIALSVGTLTVTEKPKPEPRRTFNLTINYVYQNGKRAAASYNRGGLKNGETFDITSPVIAGYTASETVVSGTIYNRDIKVTVIYTADGVNLDDYGVPLGLGNITMNVGDCFE